MNYEQAQSTFDSAFAIHGVEQSPVYPILLNEQATLLVYVGEGDRAFEMKKKVLPYLPDIHDLEKHISVYNDLAILYRQRHMNDSTLYYYNKALEVALKYKDEGWITHIYNNVSILYFNIRQMEQAENTPIWQQRTQQRPTTPFLPSAHGNFVQPSKRN